MTFAQRKKALTVQIVLKYLDQIIVLIKWSSKVTKYVGEYVIGNSRYGKCPTSNEFSKTELYFCIITKPYFRSKSVKWYACFKVNVHFWWKQWISSRKSLKFSYHSNPWKSWYLIYLNCLPNIYYKNWNCLEFAQIFIVWYHRFKT